MDVEKTPLEGVLLIKPKIWGDERGYFVETWQDKRYIEHGIDLPFVQDNHSKSCYGTLRGLHYQKSRPQGKLVSVSYGSVYDVVLDIRKNSPSYGKWYGVEINHENQWQVWIPPGLAHGFMVTSDIAHFHYKVTDFYMANDEGCVRWNSPKLNITWPLNNPILSEKDIYAPLWEGI